MDDWESTIKLLRQVTWQQAFDLLPTNSQLIIDWLTGKGVVVSVYSPCPHVSRDYCLGLCYFGVSGVYLVFLSKKHYMVFYSYWWSDFVSICCYCLQVDGTSLHGKDNQQAVEILKQTGPVVKLKVARHILGRIRKESQETPQSRCPI